MYETNTHRDRVRLSLDGREPDRVPVFNLVHSQADPSAPEHDLRPMPGSSICVLSADLSPRYPEQILERDGDDIVRTDRHGCVTRVNAGRTRPAEILDYPLKTRHDWELIAPRMEPDPDRVDWEALKAAHEQARAGGLSVAWVFPAGFSACAAFTGARSLVDLIGCDPGLVCEAAEVQAHLVTGMADLLLDGGLELDAALLFDEMADRKGPLYSSRRFGAVFAPAYRWLSAFFHGRRMKVMLYSCGDLRLLIPHLLEAGVDCLGPLEVAAGMNLQVLRLNYGADLAFLGGIDRRALEHPDPSVLEREIEVKVRAGMVNGRYIAGFDGPLPAGTPADCYARASELLATYGKY